MTGKTTYRVSQRDGVWAIELAGDSYTELATSKGSAVARATELAHRLPHAAVQVLDSQGRVEREIEIGAAED